MNNHLTWDAKEPSGSYQDFIRSEGRYKSLLKTNPAAAEELYNQAEADAAKTYGNVQSRW